MPRCEAAALQCTARGQAVPVLPLCTAALHANTPLRPAPPPPFPPPQVEYSKQLNESRIKVLQAREDAVQTLLHEAFSSLAAFSKDQAAYKRLLTDLLVQVRHQRAAGLRAAGCWPLGSDRGPWTPGSGLLGSRLWVSGLPGFGLRVAGFRAWGSRLWAAGCGRLGCGLWTPGSGLLDSGLLDSGLWAPGCGLWTPGCGLWAGHCGSTSVGRQPCAAPLAPLGLLCGQVCAPVAADCGGCGPWRHSVCGPSAHRLRELRGVCQSPASRPPDEPPPTCAPSASLCLFPSPALGAGQVEGAKGVGALPAGGRAAGAGRHERSPGGSTGMPPRAEPGRVCVMCSGSQSAATPRCHAPDGPDARPAEHAQARDAASCMAGSWVPTARRAPRRLQAKFKQEFGRPAPELELDTKHPLPPPPQAGTHTHDDEFQSW